MHHSLIFFDNFKNTTRWAYKQGFEIRSWVYFVANAETEKNK